MRTRMVLLIVLCTLCMTAVLVAGESGKSTEAPAPQKAPSWTELILRHGGIPGWLIIGLSVVALALVIDHLLTIRRNRLIPPRLAEQADALIAAHRYVQAGELCHSHPSFLARVLSAGLDQIESGPTAMDRAMEETAQEQTARLARRTEFLSMIGNIAPMLGLLGTVIGMITAFGAVAMQESADVAPALAKGIYHALITTCMGLIVAIPCLAAYSIFRNRIDQLSAETALLAEQIFGRLLRGAHGAVPAVQVTPTAPPAGPGPAS